MLAVVIVMSLFKQRKEKTLRVRVFSKEQKEAFLDILSEGYEKAKVISKTSKTIDYEVVFNYTINFKSFMYAYRSLYPKFKFMILSIE